jgi:Protein of unknown function (DUF3800)
MYVDDSGSPNAKDNTDYYVISGLIIHETDIRQVEIRTQEYKCKYFQEYADTEIHVHDILKSQHEFSVLTLERKYELLDSLYMFIDILPINVISVGIDKINLIRYYPHWNTFNAAWTFLTEKLYSNDTIQKLKKKTIKINDNIAKR